MKYIFGLIILSALTTAVTAASYPAQVLRIVDGDTLVLRWDGQEENVRIIGIDTPEIHTGTTECFGQEAFVYAQELLPPLSPVIFEFNNEYDRYDRALGYIILADGRDFGQTMIANGYAYAFRSFDHERMNIYTTVESVARLDGRGLWAEGACGHTPEAEADDTLDPEPNAWLTFLWAIIFFILDLF